MGYFLSCDWGTTSLRLRLADTGKGEIVAEIRSTEGINKVFELWQQSGGEEEKKTRFYGEVIDHHVSELETQTGQRLNNLPLVLSGMASSSIGFIDLPYASMPFDVDGSAINTGFIAASDSFEHDILFISGAKNENDVMRGEETQLIGCIAPGQWVKNELFIFPGTHSKHITVKENQAIDLRTYMTGELFSLLATQSILKNTVQPGDFYPGAFKRGLIEAAHRNMLNLIFKVRTNGLFDVCTGSENYHYLSGLLIGTELKDLSLSNAETVNLVCGNDLLTQYQLALSELAPDKKLNIFSVEQGDAATVVGQLTIAKHLKILK